MKRFVIAAAVAVFGSSAFAAAITLSVWLPE
jgi:hypothetical protein